MTKNEIVLIDWLGYNFTKGVYVGLNYEILHEAWVKFRDLEFDDSKTGTLHLFKCADITQAIINKPITEAFDELVKGIEWYNGLNPNEKRHVPEP